MKHEITVIAVGILLGLLSTSVVSTAVEKTVELARCSYHTSAVEQASKGEATLTWGFFTGCDIKAAKGV